MTSWKIKSCWRTIITFISNNWVLATTFSIIITFDILASMFITKACFINIKFVIGYKILYFIRIEWHNIYLRWQCGKPKYPGSHWSQLNPVTCWWHWHCPEFGSQFLVIDPSWLHPQSENKFMISDYFISILLSITILKELLTFTIWKFIKSIHTCFTKFSTNGKTVALAKSTNWVTKIVNRTLRVTIAVWSWNKNWL